MRWLRDAGYRLCGSRRKRTYDFTSVLLWGGSDQCDLFHDHVDLRTVLTVGTDTRNAVNDLHAFDNVTECCILTVKEGRIRMADEELGGCGVVTLGASHGDDAALVGEGILDTVDGKLALDGFIGAAHTGTGRVAALDHEAGNDAVEDQTVIEALGNELFKVCAGDGSGLRVEFDLDDAAVGHFDLYHSDCSPFCHGVNG